MTPKLPNSTLDLNVSDLMQFMLLNQGKIDNLLNQEDFPIESINVYEKHKTNFNSSFSIFLCSQQGTASCNNY